MFQKRKKHVCKFVATRETMQMMYDAQLTFFHNKKSGCNKQWDGG